MVSVKTVKGFARAVFMLRLRITIFFHYLPLWVKGQLGFRRFILFFRRLLLVFNACSENKFVRVGGQTRMHLYIPAVPSRAYITACDKLLRFDEKLPPQALVCAITSACRFNCEHCYQKLDKGAQDVALDRLTDAVRQIQDLGVSYIIFEGGDPFLSYERLRTLCQTVDHRSELWVFSTGDRMTLERLQELKDLNLAAVTFSMHSPEEKEHNKFVKSDRGWEIMDRGISMCHRAGIPIAFNMCLGKEAYYNGDFEKMMNRAKDFGGAIIQLIHPKPAGGWLECGVPPFSKDDIAHVKSLVKQYNLGRGYEAYPSISAQVMEEDAERFGCTAGGTERIYINAKGDVQPCEFLNISFGNIGHESFDRIYERMRSHFKTACTGWLCQDYSREILRVYRENQLKSLPLDPELSEQVCRNWDRGRPTPLYERIEMQLR